MFKKKQCLFEMLKNVGFYNNIPKIGLNSAKMKDALNNLPKVIGKIRSQLLPAIENVEDSSDLEGQRVKIVISSDIIDIYTRRETLLGLNLSGHTDTLTGASNLIDELYKRGEIQNKQEYRNALNKITT